MTESKESLLRMKIGILILLIVFIGGTYGFYVLEEEAKTILDAFYYTLVTISTVGYGDVTPQTQAGRILAIVIIFFGVGSVFVTIPTFFELIVQKELKEVLKLPEEQVELVDHIIVCGWGKVGKSLVDELAGQNKNFVIIEHSKERVNHLVERGFYVIEGEATSEEVLEDANIKKASLLVSTLSDADNVFVTLTSKILNPDVKIICKMDYPNNEPKLRTAGADEIVNCNDIGAKKIVSFT